MPIILLLKTKPFLVIFVPSEEMCVLYNHVKKYVSRKKLIIKKINLKKKLNLKIMRILKNWNMCSFLIEDNTKPFLGIFVSSDKMCILNNHIQQNWQCLASTKYRIHPRIRSTPREVMLCFVEWEECSIIKYFLKSFHPTQRFTVRCKQINCKLMSDCWQSSYI